MNSILDTRVPVVGEVQGQTGQVGDVKALLVNGGQVSNVIDRIVD